MNRLVADALIERAKQGKHVLVISHTQEAVRQAFTEVVDQPLGGSIAHRANGKAWVAIGPRDGRITFTTPGDMHGRKADLVYIEREADERLARDMYNGVRALVATTGGDIIRE